MDEDIRRQIPRTDALLADVRLADATERVGRAAVRDVVRDVQRRVRLGELEPRGLVDAVLSQLSSGATQLTPIINATGVVLHTNLGRAPLSEAARAAIVSASGYVDLEYDLVTGRRGARGVGAIAAALAAVPAAGAAHVVNNAAAAMLLVSAGLAHGREVLISRGEMIEIGDGFRLPSLVESAGAILREVGSTNRTHLRDYAAALSDRTAFILKVHSSNFRMEGFTASVSIEELATLGIPVVADLGSGLLAPNPLLPREPDVQSALEDGARVVACSGDKLLGGPQCGLLFGDSEVIGALRRHPMARALRADKLTLAALEATLRGSTTPVWQSLGMDGAEMRRRCAHLADVTGAELVCHDGEVGGGVASGERLPGWAAAYEPRLGEALRRGRPPVVGRVTRNRLLLDLRCVPPEADADLIAAVLACT